MFGTANDQFLHNLQGNTQVARSTRQITKSVDPRNHAAWPLKELHRRLSEYAYEIYDTLDHPALGQSPREAFDTATAQTGNRSHRKHHLRPGLPHPHVAFDPQGHGQDHGRDEA